MTIVIYLTNGRHLHNRRQGRVVPTMMSMPPVKPHLAVLFAEIERNDRRMLRRAELQERFDLPAVEDAIAADLAFDQALAEAISRRGLTCS
jgi:hypothetical protein